MQLAISQGHPYNGAMSRISRLYLKRGKYLIKRLIHFAVFFCILASACQPVVNSEPIAPTAKHTLVIETLTDLPTPSLPATITPTQTGITTGTATETRTPTPTETTEPAATGTSTVTPTYSILRGEVMVRSNCRYGPGAPYLYKYGLVVGSNLEVIGRTDVGTWILVRAIGGNNPCWVKASLMDIKGDVMTVEPTYLPLPQSPYYGPPTGVSAAREGNEVTVAWNGISFRAGDETASPPYLVEAWVCTDGRLIFTPIGSYETVVKIRDEPGCSEPSHGRVYGVEKHGYTRWIEIPWPPPPHSLRVHEIGLIN